jgi:hypothetical protein
MIAMHLLPTGEAEKEEEVIICEKDAGHAIALYPIKWPIKQLLLQF